MHRKLGSTMLGGSTGRGGRGRGQGWIARGALALGLAAGSIGASGCGDDAQGTPTKDFTVTLDMSVPADLNMETTPAQLHGDFHDYAINQIILPTKPTDYAIDLDGDGTLDNQLGVIIGILNTLNLDLQLGVDQAVRQGTQVTLISMQTADSTLQNDSAVGVTLYLGKPTNGMLTDRDDMDHLDIDGGCTDCPDFTGAGMFMVDTTIAPKTFLGKLAGGKFSSNDPIATTQPLTVTIRLTLWPGVDPVDFVVNGAQSSFETGTDVASGKPGLLKGTVRGSVKNTDVTGTIMPGVAKVLTKIITDAPDSGSAAQIKTNFDVGCVSGDMGMVGKGDSKIDACELSANAIVQAVLAPDVQIYDDKGNYAPNKAKTNRDSLSVAIGFTAVQGTFTRP